MEKETAKPITLQLDPEEVDLLRGALLEYSLEIATSEEEAICDMISGKLDLAVDAP